MEKKIGKIESVEKTSCSGGAKKDCSCSDFMSKPTTRRGAIAAVLGGAVATVATVQATTSILSEEQERALSDIQFKEYFKKNYRVMSDEERLATITRLEKKAHIETGKKVHIDGTDPIEGVLFGYAFNLSKCNGSRKCIEACCDENNQDRKTNMEYIRLFEMENGDPILGSGTAEYNHQLPPDGKYWMGTQCHQCDNPPCVDVCPVGATWKEKDGIVVIDYDWCVGCRYCQAACPYWARRFNWQEPTLPADELNTEQHYLGNRPRDKGVMEKCTFCIQRSRKGQNPACVDACPTGARVFGNLLDPTSEIRWILKNKKVFRLKEDLGTEPKFWYYMD